jgi:metal transporter CNNM
MDYLIIVILVCFSALFSGLTLGFFSLGKQDLERKAKLGNRQAEKVYQVRKDGNLLLCTLLIGNVAVNATLSIFLGSIGSGVVAGVIATSLIVVFGEIIPQSVFSRYALVLGAKFAWLVRLFIFVFYLICRPMAWILDKMLGREMPAIYSKKELIKIIEQHEDSQESDIDSDEEKIVKGALSYADKKVKDIMTPRTEMFCLPGKQELDHNTLKKIFSKGHSRIPVYENDRDNITGILYVKDLILNKNVTAGRAARANVIFTDPEQPLDDLLNAFKNTRQHLFIVSDEYGMVWGIVTIEDVLEEIIGSEIVDEFDQHEDLRKLAQEKTKYRSRGAINGVSA